MMLKILCLQQNKPFLYRKLSFQVPFHAPGGAGGEASKNFFSFFLQSYIKIFLRETKLKKNAGTKKNYITTLNKLNLCLFAKVQKLF